MTKHIHTLIINKFGKNSRKYIYDFGSTKNVELILSETGISITAQLTKVYDKEEMLSGDSYLFPDAIKKALLLYLLKYNKAPNINSITVKIDDEQEEIPFPKGAKPPIYSMINGNLQRDLSKEFSNDTVFEYLLKTPKSKYDKRIASLFALLCSKSKEYETERFIYLWTSFNGMYGWISEFVAKANGVERYRKEYMQILGFQQFIDVGKETIAEKDKSPIANSVISILKDVSSEQASRSAVEDKTISKRIEGVLNKDTTNKYNLTAYGYLLTQLAYYFRCKIVHGSKPVYLFSYGDDKELHSLKIINTLLEEFIDNNLPLWFDDNYINNIIIPKTDKIKLK